MAKYSDVPAIQASPSVWLQCVLSLLAVLVIAAAVLLQRPPPARDADAPSTQFSAARALSQLRSIAQRPHPVGSAEHAQVRDTLVHAFSALGAQVHVEDGTGVFNEGDRRVVAGSVNNIVALFPGIHNQRTVMLTAHYDSVSYGPGAADDGAGVVSILEAMRAVRAGPPLRNDVRVVITDGEEAGLLGASAYVAAHPQLAQQVGVVLNFEARGSSGPVMMFETSSDNGWLVGQLAQAAPFTIASSLMYTAYQHMPNDTDLTVFRRAGLQGMNFALVGSYQDYHTPLDSVATLAPDTLQHMGSYALALTRQFGNATFPATRTADQVYFNAVAGWFVHYPLWVVWVLLALMVVLWLVVMAVAVRQYNLRLGSLAAGLAGFFLTMVAVLTSMSALWWVVHALFGSRLLFGDTQSNKWLAAGLVLIGVAAALCTQRALVGRRAGIERSIGSLLAFGLLGIVVCVTLPGGSFLFEWPLIVALVGLLLALLARRVNTAALLVWLGAVPVLLLFAPLLQSLLVMLGMNWVAVIAIALLLGLACTAASPLLSSLARGARMLVPILLLGAFACVLAGISMSHFSAQHPQRASLNYSVDADHGKAAWVSWDEQPNPSTMTVLGKQPQHAAAAQFMNGNTWPVMTHVAPLLPLLPPVASLRSETVSNGVHTLDLHVDSPRGAPVLKLWLAPEVHLLSLAWNGQAPITLDAGRDADDPWQFSYSAVPATGVDLQLRFTGEAPLTCHLADFSYGLPTFVHGGYQSAADAFVAWGNGVQVNTLCNVQSSEKKVAEEKKIKLKDVKPTEEKRG